MRRFYPHLFLVAVLFPFPDGSPEASVDGPGAPPPPGQAGSDTRGSLGELPGSWLGDLPCADCAGIRHQLDLFPDGVFHLRKEYLGESHAEDQIGEWVLGEAGILALDPAGPSPASLLLRPGGGLRLLDREGREIEGGLNYDLARVWTIRPLTPRLRMTGLLRGHGDQAIFAECLTGRELAVLPGPGRDSLDSLETVAGAAGAGRTEDLKLEVMGRLVPRRDPSAETGGFALIVDRIVDVYRGETCGARGSRSDLEGTRWKLTRLGAAPIGAAADDPDEREAFLALDRVTGRVSASAGCNRLTGTYERKGDSLTFGQMGGTKMACPGPLMEREREFTAMLARVRGWQLSRHTLELIDEQGNAAARFEARELR